MIAEKQVLDEPACIPTQLNIAGIPVVPFETYDHALEGIEWAIESNRKSFCVAVNPIKMYNAWHDPELLKLLQQTDINPCRVSPWSRARDYHYHTSESSSLLPGIGRKLSGAGESVERA